MFNNLGRQIVDSALTGMARGVLKKKKKDLVRIMEREGDNTPAYLMGVANRLREVTAFEKNKAGFAVAFDYKKATHYYVSSLPAVVTLSGLKDDNRLRLIEGIGDMFTIETISGEVDIFAQFMNLTTDNAESGEVLIDNKKIIYSFNVFVKASTDNVCPVHYPLFAGYIADNWYDIYFVANDYHPFTKTFDTRRVKFVFEGNPYSVNAITVKGKSAKLIGAVFEHLIDCVTVLYKEINSSKVGKTVEEETTELLEDFLNKALSGKPIKLNVSKERAISKAHEPKIEVEVEDKLVPLHRYIKEYNPSIKRISKGGHHASPVPHDRRGFFRRSRGKGDYELINGEFVFVGNKEGSYSWVPATRVGKKKSENKPTLIYKV